MLARLSFLAFTFRIVSLQLFEQFVEALKADLPILAVSFQPFGGLCERLGHELAWASLCIQAARNEARPLQHFEVFGNRRLAHRERRGQLLHLSLSRRETCKDFIPRRIWRLL